MQIITELHCFGNIRFWVEIAHAKKILIEKHECFQKTGYRNRYEILSATGPLLLTIPVVGGRGQKNLITDTSIKNTEKWQLQHWRALESCYNHSPFFMYYADKLKLLYTAKYHNLFDWNMAAIQWVAQQLKLTLFIDFTENYEKNYPLTVKDLRNCFKQGNRLPSGIFFERYMQVFGKEFQQNLCILDAIFNMGNSTLGYLQSQKVFYETN